MESKRWDRKQMIKDKEKERKKGQKRKKRKKIIKEGRDTQRENIFAAIDVAKFITIFSRIFVAHYLCKVYLF